MKWPPESTPTCRTQQPAGGRAEWERRWPVPGFTGATKVCGAAEITDIRKSPWALTAAVLKEDLCDRDARH